MDNVRKVSGATGKPLSFKGAVEACGEIKHALQPGLSALKGNSKTVKASDPKLLEGSVDIDGAVKTIYPQDARWDYVVGYGEEAFFIEVHPANTSNVDEMVKKVEWLKKWLVSSAPELGKLHGSGAYYWIPSGGVNILKGSVQDRRIARCNLQIKKPVVLTVHKQGV